MVDMESVAVVASRTEAELIVDMLRSHGLSAAFAADDAGGQEPQLQMQGVNVLVPPSDVASAQRLLAGTSSQREGIVMTAQWPVPAGLHMASVRLPVEGELPSFDGATGWLNSPPLTEAAPRISRPRVVRYQTSVRITRLRRS